MAERPTTFKPGNKAGAQGKKHGYRNERLLRGLTHAQLQKLLRDTYDAAEEGDKDARAFLLNKYIATPKSEAPRVMFDLDVTSLDKAAVSIIQAVASAQIGVDDGKDLMKILADAAVIGEQRQLSQRIAELESKQGMNRQVDITPNIIHIDYEEGKAELPGDAPSWLANARKQN